VSLSVVEYSLQQYLRGERTDYAKGGSQQNLERALKREQALEKARIFLLTAPNEIFTLRGSFESHSGKDLRCCFTLSQCSAA